MSDAHEKDHDGAADAHHDHDFDGEPARTLGPDEAPTPGWVSGVGAAVFALAGVYFLAGDSAPSGPEKPAKAAPVVQAAPPPAATQVVATAMPARPPSGAPSGSAAIDALKRMPPEQMKDLQRRIQEAAQKAKPQGDGAK
jgi:hypothetical protein